MSSIAARNHCGSRAALDAFTPPESASHFRPVPAVAVYLIAPHRIHRNQRPELPDCSSSSARSMRSHVGQRGISDPVRVGVCGCPSPSRRDGGRRITCPFWGTAQVSAGGTSQAWLAAEALRKAEEARWARVIKQAGIAPQ